MDNAGIMDVKRKRTGYIPTKAGGDGNGNNDGGGGGGSKPKALTKAEKAVAAIEALNKRADLAMSSLQAKLNLNLAQTDNPAKEAQLTAAYRDQVKSFYQQATATEKRTRGTAAHAAAQSYLNQMTGAYASAIEQANSAQKSLAASTQKTADATSDLADQLNRVNSTNSSNSWLAARSLASGPTQANFGGFIEVPVVIDGQTVFRATQRYSLLNNRRNVGNGLATSGSLI
jgi:hypothetical protein